VKNTTEIKTQTTPTQIQTQVKKPWLAAILSLFIPGVGQIYNGQIIKGIVILIIGIILVLIGITSVILAFYPIGAAYEAYADAKKINRGEIKI
jgi:TM2 domain-containing membrane protein YozV